MEGVVKGMKRKRERHFNETKTIVSIAVIIAGIVSGICLLVIWPQKFSIDIFNSRLAYHLILDIEDYFTCDKDYINFVIDEPDADYALLSFYIFNVTNAASVFLKGEKPSVEETGPFGYVKNTYKYDIEFDPVNSLTVSFKEYSQLTPVDESEGILCENMFYHLERDYLLADACLEQTCYCKNPSSKIIIINPLFLKTLWKDTPFEMLAHYSVEVFKNVKGILDEPFTEAVKAHLMTLGYQEVYLFRMHMQVGQMFSAAVTSLSKNYTVYQMAHTYSISTSAGCNLGQFGIVGCPFAPYAALYDIMYRQFDIPNSSYPFIDSWFNSTNNDSFINFEYGLPKWLGLVNYFGLNTKVPYVMISRAEMAQTYYDMALNLATNYFGESGVTANTILGAQRIVVGFARFIAINFLNPYSVTKLTLQSLAYQEFIDNSEVVACSPLGFKCVWSWGYMTKVLNIPYKISTTMAATLIDVGSAVSTNPSNLYKDINAPPWYNVYLYDRHIRRANASFQLSCTEYGDSINDALVTRPAGIWATDHKVSTVNSTYLNLAFQAQNSTVTEHYQLFASNVTYLLHEVYRKQTGFHDEYVVRYLNVNRDPNFKHNFTVGNWTELGLAQWGGGFVTYALVQVRSTNEMIRDGMWRIGYENYYNNYMEYSSWSIRQGYNQAYIYDVEEARVLLDKLSEQTDDGVDFRRHLFYIGSTYIGDNKTFVNGVGAIGEITFTPEANLGNFSCNGTNTHACEILSVDFASSSSVCLAIDAAYQVCSRQYVFNSVRWIDKTNCGNFETSMTSPTSGIQCDLTTVYGQNHPYVKSRGNIVFQMAYHMTIQLLMNEGLWCGTADNCDYQWGGLFATTSVTKALFGGYTEPSILKYYNLKYYKYGLQFQCIHEPFNDCHTQLYNCNNAGVVLILSNGYKLNLTYGSTDNDVYFAPEFIVTKDNTLLWPYSSNATLASQSLNYMYEHPDETIIVYNPTFALYPAWTSTDVEFNKFYQCQKRTFFGKPDMFNSCVDLLYTGRDVLNKTLNIVKTHGNDSIYFFEGNYSKASLFVNGSTLNNQLNPSLYKGFNSYPYVYLGRTTGEEYNTAQTQRLFYKPHSIDLILSQDSLVFAFQRDIVLTVPMLTKAGGQQPSLTLNTRRFVEDTNTWDRLKVLGTPTDAYGMQYKTPYGMTSMERMAGFPVYAETSNSYGNDLWGGSEFSFVSGTIQNQYAQRTFVDYDPVTGRAMRQAIRQQINLKVDANVFFPNVFSSQKRCSAPSNSYNLGAGYGCWAYIPLYWFEDARVVKTETFFQIYDHFYSRPLRAYTVGVAGISMAVILIVIGSCMLTNEMYHKRRFFQRVYID